MRSLEDDVPISDRTFEINSHISVPCHLNSVNLKWRIDVAVVSEDDSSYYESEESSSESSIENHEEENEVLVVAGCKACFIYYMVPKLLKDCPKCAAQLLHFDRNHSASP
ncbi:hypothetical protein Bca52824_064091 [Brassica carinata]|uniref:Uncharacterized protein n=1 Tax=Brassica carinata TaxID=52824 RepID=A0A8X7U9T6_BRACI|nr:hypothetical protein Bca52824_064091 [Brassica carinata]